MTPLHSLALALAALVACSHTITLSTPPPPIFKQVLARLEELIRREADRRAALAAHTALMRRAGTAVQHGPTGAAMARRRQLHASLTGSSSQLSVLQAGGRNGANGGGTRGPSSSSVLPTGAATNDGGSARGGDLDRASSVATAATTTAAAAQAEGAARGGGDLEPPPSSSSIATTTATATALVGPAAGDTAASGAGL